MKRKLLTLTFVAVAVATFVGACSKENTFILDDWREITSDHTDGRSFNLMKQSIKVPGSDATVDVVFILKGEFDMGAEYFDPDAFSYEKPQHHVVISKDFGLAVTPVTQALYEAVMDTNPVRTWAEAHPELQGFLGADKPVVWVTYEDAVEFCNKLSAKTGKHFYLPSEAQWEYAARGGHAALPERTKYSGSNILAKVGWYALNTPVDTIVYNTEEYDEETGMNNIITHRVPSQHIMPVRSKERNIIDVYDMSGNVWEWCADYFYYYSTETQTDPVGLDTLTYHGQQLHYHVYRGGAWNSNNIKCRLSYRYPHEIAPENFTCDSTIGFRVAMEL
jgi:formylglycine-generating enzyme required for sulfatase activity